MDKRRRHLTLEPVPDLVPEKPLDLGKRRKRREEPMEEAEANRAVVGDQLKRSVIGISDPHLAVADDAVATELEPRDAEIGDLHAILAEVL
jgi:hypothetical protein